MEAHRERNEMFVFLSTAQKIRFLNLSALNYLKFFFFVKYTNNLRARKILSSFSNEARINVRIVPGSGRARQRETCNDPLVLIKTTCNAVDVHTTYKPRTDREELRRNRSRRFLYLTVPCIRE